MKEFFSKFEDKESYLVKVCEFYNTLGHISLLAKARALQDRKIEAKVIRGDLEFKWEEMTARTDFLPEEGVVNMNKD